ncbi:MAG: VWA domain-containing protein [Spirochaetaceae bacterium]|nr:VWA domain-containing protein [Spirochaetaceae bacterium]
MVYSLHAQERILRTGFTEKAEILSGMPPLNVFLVVDASRSMVQDNKIAWVKEAVIGFAGKLRASDALALISFNTVVTMRFDLTRMDGVEKRRRFLNAVSGLSPEGGTKLEAAFTAGYEEGTAHYQEGRLNLVILCTDEVDFSSFNFDFSNTRRYELLETYNTQKISMAALRIVSDKPPVWEGWEEMPAAFAAVAPLAQVSAQTAPAGFSERTLRRAAPEILPEEPRSRMFVPPEPEVSRISKGTGGISRISSGTGGVSRMTDPRTSD